MSDSDKPARTKALGNINTWFFIGCVALGALIVFLNITSHKPSAPQKRYQSECHKAKSRYWVILDNSLEALSANEDTEAGKREKKGREQVTYWCDLFAQQAAADAARYAATQALWVTLLTGLGVALVGGTLLFTAKTLREAQKTTREAKRSADAAFKAVEVASIGERPWLKLTLTPRSRIVIVNSTTIEIEITGGVENLGKMPAANYVVHAAMCADVGGEDVSGNIFDRAAEKARASAAADFKRDIGDVVYVGSPVPFNVRAGFAIDQIKFDPDNPIVLTYAICAMHTTPTGEGGVVEYGFVHVIGYSTLSGPTLNQIVEDKGVVAFANPVVRPF